VAPLLSCGGTLKESAEVDALYAELLAAGESAPKVAGVFGRSPDEETVIAVLHRAVPLRALEHLARTPPWSERSRVLAGIVLNPKSPPRLSVPLVPALLWRALADVAVSPRVPSAVRLRAEAVLKDKIPELRLGEKITLGRLATTPVLLALLDENDPRILEACLENPRLRETDLVGVVRRPEANIAVLHAVAGARRWLQSYAVRLELAVQPRTPLAIALAQLSSLMKKDLLRVAETKGLLPLVQAAARRVAEEK
jgi:hypothetical protein